MISIHALLAESDSADTGNPPQSARFLSTLSLRRATRSQRWIIPQRRHFYPRSPCGERPVQGCGASLHRCYFYPRSPCGERRGFVVGSWPRVIFLSTLSLRRATDVPPVTYGRAMISIHALLAESDCSWQRNGCQKLHFYPRSPCGERLWRCWPGLRGCPISIHALLAESDPSDPGSGLIDIISIHALLAESDARRGSRC